MSLMSGTQQGIWFTERHGSAGTAYHLAITVDLDGPLDIAALEAACRDVVARQGALRLAVRDTEAGPLLVAAEHQPCLHRAAYHDGLVDELISQPFDLSTGPLARMVLAERGPQRHLLIVVAHHLIFDGMSKDILVSDLAAAYRPGASGGAPEPVVPSFVDVVRAHQDETEPALPAAREFWARTLASAPHGVTLPGLRQTPQAADVGATVTCDLDPATTAAVHAAAQEAGVSRFEWLLTALGVLLRRYGEPDPVVAVDVSTRPPEATSIIGMFVNELPVALPDPEERTFAGAAAQTRRLLREAYRHRGVPAGRAVTGLRPGAALTPVSVSYRRRPDTVAVFEGLRAEVDWAVFGGAARNALHLQAVDHGDRIALRLAFAPRALDPAAADRIGRHLLTLLTASTREPDRRATSLPVLPAGERHLLLEQANDTARPYPCRETTLDRLFAEQVAAVPQAPAVTHEGRTWTYAELDAAVERTAGDLRSAGVGGGDIVAVCLPRSPEMLVTLLATGRIGAAYLPVDPAYPQARQSMILDDAKPALAVTPEWIAGRRDSGRRECGRRECGHGETGADDLAYVIYTSGTTGRPKGVEITRSSLVNLLLSLRDELGSTGGDTWLALTSPAFDIAAVELYLPLVTGGRVVIAPDAITRDGARINELIRDGGITHVQATPSGWRMLLETGFAGGTACDGRPVALVGGEALPLALARQLRLRTSRLFNVYGPTETTIWSTIEEIAEDPAEVTIGRPLANTTVYVLDGQRQPVPVGVEGELFIGGWGVARGYHGRDDLTAERFVADPFAGGDARMYRTGDRARMRPDLRIDFLGRSDNQIKIRGHRVELGEIEGLLLENPGVAQAAVALRTDQDGEDPRLVGYIVSDTESVDPAALREYLEKSLPVAAVPTVWVRLDRLPLTPNGKLDRAALPTPTEQDLLAAAGQRAERPAASAAPADPVTEEVREIFESVLGVQGIGDDEDLFDLGGHSLTITRISARITKQLGVTIPLDLFYETPTVAEIAEEVRSRTGAPVLPV